MCAIGGMCNNVQGPFPNQKLATLTTLSCRKLLQSHDPLANYIP